MQNKDKKKLTVVLLEALIALIFVLGVGERYPSLKVQFHNYFADVAIPFGFYFLLAANEPRVKFLQSSATKAILIFLLCSTSEILQYFGIYALATTFDPIDFAMYGVGVVLAVFVDKQIFSRLLSFWPTQV